jgi:hypothetical protein
MVIGALLSLICISSTFADDAQNFIAPGGDAFASSFIILGMSDGSYWMRLTDREKETYLLAYHDGMTADSIFYIKEEKQRYESTKSFPAGDLGVLASAIDRIYADEGNLEIPIPYAIVIVRNKLLGVEQKKIDAYIEYLRRKIKEKEAGSQEE